MSEQLMLCIAINIIGVGLVVATNEALKRSATRGRQLDRPGFGVLCRVDCVLEQPGRCVAR
jgi:hypothetical protein